MANPSRQDIINAYAAVEVLTNTALSTADFCGGKDKFLMRRQEIIKLLPPKPAPTMAELEWNDDGYCLAEAEHDVYGRVVMLGLNTDGLIDFFTPHLREYGCNTDRPETLTPTGNRYELKEITNG